MSKQILLGLTFFFYFFSGYSQNFSTGCLFSKEKYENVLAAPMLTSRSYEDLPVSYTLRQFAPIPDDQGKQSSCVGWASAYGARTILESVAIGRTNANSSKDSAFSPSFVYNQIKLSRYDCDNGSYISDAVELLKVKGALRLAEFPYNCGQPTSLIHFQKAKNHIISDYVRLTNSVYDDKQTVLKTIKKGLVDNSPIVIGIMTYQSFFTTKNVWSGVKDSPVGGHAMCLIGYDDSKYGGAFEILNSWGSQWGENGYCWIRYDDFLDIAGEVYQVIGMQKPLPVDPEPIDPKPIEPLPVVEDKSDLQGSIRLVKDNKADIQVTLTKGAERDFEIVEIEKPVYKAQNAIYSGDKFRIYFASNKSAYVYIISYGTKTKKAKPVYPFKNISAYIPSGNSEVAIPNENYYIQVDNNTGTDYLTFLYCKYPIDIQSICNKINASDGSFISRMKKSLSGKILFSKDVEFTEGNAGFKANVTSRYVLPISIEFEHK
ncbi:MAG: DUF4384 domain-containing protein [Terrimonas sp.]|nr:DUF4384 domain-containing protein [Terrimonas sp.]OJY81344.1 MAG: hypothetical protein BGP13_15195 [Sphingobacteriales bacterium 40-81]